MTLCININNKPSDIMIQSSEKMRPSFPHLLYLLWRQQSYSQQNCFIILNMIFAASCTEVGH